MTDILILAAAFGLDLLIGDPRGLPHPVRIIGHGISIMENEIRKFVGTKKLARVGGIILTASVVGSVFILSYAVNLFIRESINAGGISAFIAITFAIVLAATTIAVRDLLDSARAVISAIRAGAIAEARESLGMIVGRDTASLADKGILKATIETLAENLSDGIVAPLFYFSLGGLPLAMTYKAVNTLDSMVGYKNEKYIDIGWASAKLDDLANYLPARISGCLIVLSVLILYFFVRAHDAIASTCRSFVIMLRDGRKHSSPNSGIPEAAMAGGLGVMLGGPSTYGGVLINKPTIGDELASDYIAAADKAIIIIFISSLLGLVFSIFIMFLRNTIC
ncbi:MAG TPA: adenosylcobinamide-phosphate synthase CbiB [Dissulfurispiraceae bacterium]|nr:adenosylcobinamide-phosphate synthase CbiB [Dissulfurispiraceae bacterium]